MRRILIACVLALLAAGLAFATPEKGAICKFAAGDIENPFGRWLRSQEVTCVDSESFMTFPPGLWNVYQRSATGISIEPTLVDSRSVPAPLTFALAPAARLSLRLPQGMTGVIYAPKHRIGYPAAEHVTVPSGEELWLFVLSKSSPVAFLEIPAIPEGSERAVDARNVSVEPMFIGWIQIPDEDRNALQTARGVSQPRVTMKSGTKETEALSLPHPEVLSGSFAVLRGIPPGPAELRLAGRGWLTYRRQIQVAPQSITTALDPIIARASARLVVNWSAPYNLAELDRSVGSCEPPRDVPRFDLILSTCGTRDTASCQPFKTESLQPGITFGTVAIDEVVPGFYRAELRYGKLPVISVTDRVLPLQQRPISLQAAYNTAYGDLTRGGKPLGEDARLEFPGNGIGFADRESGEYHGVLTQMLGVDAKIDIKTCKGDEAFVLTDRPVRPNGRFDIDIPDNALTITVIDTFTRAPLPGATLHLVVMSLSRRAPVLMRNLGLKEDDARLVLRGVPVRELRIDVTNNGYKKKQLDPFSLTKSEKKEIEVQLEPLAARQGKIVSGRPFKGATLFWFAASGAEIERADVAPDGTFEFGMDHFRDETMTLVSVSHPLWITRPVSVSRGRILELRFPDTAHARNVEVTIAGMASRMRAALGVAIGGLRVPQPALAQHQTRRDLTTVIAGEGPLLIPMLAETGPIDILRGPPQIITNPQMMEVLGLRDFAPVASQRLMPGSSTVVFEAK
ncbi:MAG TPA: hypothetical protein VII32_06175 [Thermoanaerobaculia bacterium]